MFISCIGCVHTAGLLDHGELCSFVQSIPDLTREEQKYIIGMDGRSPEYEYDVDEIMKMAVEHACGILASLTDSGQSRSFLHSGYIYQSDKNGDGQLTFNEFKAVIATFGQKAVLTVARHAA